MRNINCYRVFAVYNETGDVKFKLPSFIRVSKSIMSSAVYSEADFQEWEEYKKTHDKCYPSKEEDEKRMKLYFETKEKVRAHNEAFEKGETTFAMSINKFADQLPEEVCCGRGVAKQD